MNKMPMADNDTIVCYQFVVIYNTDEDCDWFEVQLRRSVNKMPMADNDTMVCYQLVVIYNNDDELKGVFRNILY